MDQSTSNKIIDYINKNGQATGKELADYIGSITGRAIRKQLKKLLDKNVLYKVGVPPKVYYFLSNKEISEKTISVDKSIIDVINSKYIYISPTGELNEGWKGFLLWCKKTNQDEIKTANDYISTLKKYDKYRKYNVINGLPKMKDTFSTVYLDKLFYLDFYSIERFGKTKLGQMLLYSKQSQNISLIRRLTDEIRPQILDIIKNNNIDGVLFIPPTVKREIQFMKELQRSLKLPVRILSVTKIKTDIAIPQKTLLKLEDRVENAKKTIIVDDVNSYKNVLLIDDAVGSGATLNETAKQIKARNLVKGNIIGLAITGSYKGFDVISEV